MNSNTAKQLSDAIESTLSIPIPEIDQLVHQYQISEVLEIIIDLMSGELEINMDLNPPGDPKKCRKIDGMWICDFVPESLLSAPSMSISGNSLALDSEAIQQLCINIASKLSTAVTLLSQSAQEVGEKFKVFLILDPVTANNRQTMFCKYVNDATQGIIFKYSDS
jgi:hypothetical protein